MNRTLKTLLCAGSAAALLSSAELTFGQSQPPPAPSAHPASPPAGVDPALHAAHVNQAAPPPVAGAHSGAAGDANAEWVNQIAALRAEVARLQAAIAQGHTAAATASAGGGMNMRGMSGMQPPPGAAGMSGMSGGGRGMGMMDMDQMMKGGMGGGSGEGKPGMSGGGMTMMGMDGMMKMMGMGNMPMGGAGSPAAMAMPSALPGFPGASHIYHVGATGFFLDHTDHITLTLEQQSALSQKKEQTILQQADLRRKIDQAEQELWVLTASDQPDAVAIEKKVQEIAKLQGDQRVAFIRSVGEAARMLTEEQRKQLTGMLPPAPSSAPPASGSMPGM